MILANSNSGTMFSIMTVGRHSILKQFKSLSTVLYMITSTIVLLSCQVPFVQDNINNSFVVMSGAICSG